MMYQCNGRKMNEGINLSYSLLRKTKLLIFLVILKVAVVQGIISCEWCLRSWVRSHPVLALYFFSSSISRENSGSVKKIPERGMYLSRSHTENIFPSWTVVVWRHHVYVYIHRNFTVRLVTVYLYS